MWPFLHSASCFAPLPTPALQSLWDINSKDFDFLSGPFVNDRPLLFCLAKFSTQTNSGKGL